MAAAPARAPPSFGRLSAPLPLDLPGDPGPAPVLPYSRGPCRSGRARAQAPAPPGTRPVRGPASASGCPARASPLPLLRGGISPAKGPPKRTLRGTHDPGGWPAAPLLFSPGSRGALTPFLLGLRREVGVPDHPRLSPPPAWGGPRAPTPPQTSVTGPPLYLHRERKAGPSRGHDESSEGQSSRPVQLGPSGAERGWQSRPSQASLIFPPAPPLQKLASGFKD